MHQKNTHKNEKFCIENDEFCRFSSLDTGVTSTSSGFTGGFLYNKRWTFMLQMMDFYTKSDRFDSDQVGFDAENDGFYAKNDGLYAENELGGCTSSPSVRVDLSLSSAMIWPIS